MRRALGVRSRALLQTAPPTRDAAPSIAIVGWVEQSETHRPLAMNRAMTGFASNTRKVVPGVGIEPTTPLARGILGPQIGQETCRGRVSRYGMIWVEAVHLKKKNI